MTATISISATSMEAWLLAKAHVINSLIATAHGIELVVADFGYGLTAKVPNNVANRLFNQLLEALNSPDFPEKVSLEIKLVGTES